MLQKNCNYIPIIYIYIIINYKYDIGRWIGTYFYSEWSCESSNYSSAPITFVLRYNS